MPADLATWQLTLPESQAVSAACCFHANALICPAKKKETDCRHCSLAEFITSGPIVAMQLEGADAVPAWRTLLGPTNSATAREQAPSSLRARYGTGGPAFAWHPHNCA